MNLDNIEKSLNERASTSDFFKIPTGATRARIMSDFEIIEKVWKGIFPNSKYMGMFEKGQKLGADEKVKEEYWTWAIIRGENGAKDEFKILTLGSSIIGDLVTLKKNPEYNFSKMPMPYDITINNTGDGANRYSILPARYNTEVTAEEMETMNTKKPISFIVDKMRGSEDKEVSPSEIVKGYEYPKSDDTEVAF